MWSYDGVISKGCGAVGLVLNGDYPEADLKRMSLTSLETLVAKLVQCTATAPNRPKWWPSDLSFTHPIDLGLDDEREIKLAFKQLVVSCSQFFKDREWNDENRERKWRRAERKRLKPPPPLPPPCPENSGGASSKINFLHCLKLGPRHGATVTSLSTPSTPTSKFTSCLNIPFSSDVGRIMARREHHRMPEDFKLKRLERSEWYINKGAPRLTPDIEYEFTNCKEPNHSHRFKMPKRQQHHKRISLRNVNILRKFCTPLSVNLERVDLEQVQFKRQQYYKNRKLIVKIGNSEKLCCDIRTDANLARASSPKTID